MKTKKTHLCNKKGKNGTCSKCFYNDKRNKRKIECTDPNHKGHYYFANKGCRKCRYNLKRKS